MVSKLLLTLLTFYQRYISTLMAPHCRFYPTCSQYAKEAITQHGGLRGSALAIKRVLRCHPGNPGGYDPVPEKSCRACCHPTHSDNSQH